MVIIHTDLGIAVKRRHLFDPLSHLAQHGPVTNGRASYIVCNVQKGHVIGHKPIYVGVNSEIKFDEY